MTLQDNMIGNHPTKGLFYDWTDYLDSECTENKRHRHLSTKEENIHEAIETVANWLVTYHLSKGKSMALKRKQVILEKHDFHEYAKSLHILPRADKTKKGNLGEVILTEYLSQVSSIKVLIYKLHFNPNVDQSMKGDDVLLVDEKKILLGESKFRSTPSKEAVEDVSNLMGNALALPLSLGFIADALFEQDQTELAEQILDIQYKLSRANFNIKNVGFLLSTKLVEKHVEKNMDSINKEFIIISLGMDNPTEFMELAFERAEKLLLEVPEV